MSKVLVFCESSDGKLKNGSLELLSASSSASELSAVLLGSHAEKVKEIPGQYGAQNTYICSASELDHYNSELFVATLEDIVKTSQADVILASSSLLARDLFPRLAARLKASIATDCVELHLSDSDLTVKKPLYAGKCSAKVAFSLSSKKIVLMRPNQLPISNANTSSSAQIHSVSLPQLDLKTILKEVVKGASEKLDLTEANIIVSGGRGLKDADQFKALLEPLAETLGATIGASRAVVDAGWVPHNMQVGQTGKTVAPTLYIACGISGAIQHLAGMSDSKVIVAINSDPEAPIFKKATYGIVGDAFEVVPKLTEEFKALLN